MKQVTFTLLCVLCLALTLGSFDATARPSGQGVIDSYASHVSAKIKNNLKVPPEWRKHHYETTARVDIDKNGRVTGASITNPSGNSAFDTAVLRAIRKTGHLGQPPFELYAVGLRFNSRML